MAGVAATLAGCAGEDGTPTETDSPAAAGIGETFTPASETRTTPQRVTGRVTEKRVTGTLDLEHLTLAAYGVDDDAPTVHDSVPDGTFGTPAGEAGLVVDADAAETLAEEYEDLTYRVAVHLTSRDEANQHGAGMSLTYSTTREPFNALRVGEEAAYYVDPAASNPVVLRVAE